MIIQLLIIIALLILLGVLFKSKNVLPLFLSQGRENVRILVRGASLVPAEAIWASSGLWLTLPQDILTFNKELAASKHTSSSFKPATEGVLYLDTLGIHGRTFRQERFDILFTEIVWLGDYFPTEKPLVLNDEIISGSKFLIVTTEGEQIILEGQKSLNPPRRTVWASPETCAFSDPTRGWREAFELAGFEWNSIEDSPYDK